MGAPRDVREPASIVATMTGIKNPYNESSTTLHQALRRVGVDLSMAKQLVDQIMATWHPGAAAEFTARDAG